MDTPIKEKIKFLSPKLRKKLEDLFENMDESISMLYDVATRDKKTGLYNHGFFETVFGMEIEKARRGKQKLSFMIIDIDFFKKVNDKYGHIKADDLLKQLAKVMTSHARKYDIVARFGGEEFVMILPETSLTKAKTVAKRLRELINKDKILKKHGITVSGGITQYKERDSAKTIKSRADKALYQAKNTGRNKFVAG